MPTDQNNPKSEHHFLLVEKSYSLDTIRAKLLDAKYQTVDLFINDLKLVFINAQTSYGKGTVVDFLAEEILNYIAKVENEIHSTPLEIWHRNLLKIQTKIDKHMKNMPTDFQPSISSKEK